MSLRLDVADVLIGARVDNGQRAGLCVADRNVQIFRAGVVAYVIGIRIERYTLNQLEVIPAVNLAATLLPVGHKQFLKVQGIEHPLWLALAWDAEYSPPRLQIDDLDGVLIVAQRSGEQPLAFNIYSQMIHPPLDAWHGNGLDQADRRGLLRKRFNWQYHG